MIVTCFLIYSGSCFLLEEEGLSSGSAAVASPESALLLPVPTSGESVLPLDLLILETQRS